MYSKLFPNGVNRQLTCKGGIVWVSQYVYIAYKGNLPDNWGDGFNTTFAERLDD